MKCAGLGFFGALLAALLIAVVWPQYADYTVRSKAVEWLAVVRPVQSQIESLAIKQQTFAGVGKQIAPPVFDSQRTPLRFEVRASGEILISDHEVMLLLTPSLASSGATGQTITWSCLGAPLKNVPMACRAKAS